MAESNATAQMNEQIFENQDAENVVSRTIDAVAANSLMSRLHEALDFYQLFDTFIEEFRTTVSCDSIEYNDETTQTSITNGNSGRQHCDYVLTIDEQSVGNISITRDTVFSETEVETIEVMLAGLVLPLRNALRYKQAIRSAQRDELTGLRNSSYYHDFVDLEIKRAQRYNKPFSLLLFDIDNFEKINQLYSRRVGDAVLVEVARRIERKARSSDIVYRNGGDEYLVFLPNTDKLKAIEAAMRIKDYVMADNCTYKDDDISFSISAGVVTVRDGDAACKLMDRASKSLFHAKILGKDRVYAELPVEKNQPISI